MKVKDLLDVLVENEEVKIVDIKLSKIWRGMACEIPSYYNERTIKAVYSSSIIGESIKCLIINII